MKPLLKGDIVKLTADGTEKLGLISEVGDDTMVRIATNWYNLDEFEVTVLHSEVDKGAQTMV